MNIFQTIYVGDGGSLGVEYSEECSVLSNLEEVKYTADGTVTSSREEINGLELFKL